jgi:hypothetical protein
MMAAPPTPAEGHSPNSPTAAYWINANGDSFNACRNQGEFASDSSADITEMCALGWQGCAVAVPAPLIGHGMPIFVAVGVLLVGAKLRVRSKDKSVVRLGPRGWLSLGT